MRAVYGAVRWHLMRQAKREMVLCTDCVSALLWLPATVSVTTKSMGLSVDRPIWREREGDELTHAFSREVLIICSHWRERLRKKRSENRKLKP